MLTSAAVHHGIGETVCYLAEINKYKQLFAKLAKFILVVIRDVITST